VVPDETPEEQLDGLEPARRPPHRAPPPDPQLALVLRPAPPPLGLTDEHGQLYLWFPGCEALYFPNWRLADYGPPQILQHLRKPF
jgi:hypothetical protein